MQEHRAPLNSLQHASDVELIQRAQKMQTGARGGAEAVGEIYDRYQQRIFRYVWARVSDRQLAEDLTAEVFIRMITHLSQFRSNTLLPTDASFRAWLYRIAHNLLVDHYRKTGRQPELALEQAEGLAGEHSSLAKSVEQKLLFEQAQTALQQLSQEYQDVLILRFMVGLSLQEVAQVLGKNLAVVKITQHRGLEKLRVALAAAASEA